MVWPVLKPRHFQQDHQVRYVTPVNVTDNT
jgi:hypothetical protein